MRSYDGFMALIAELDGDAREIARLLGHNERAAARIRAGANDPIDYGALGFTIHSLYGVAENYFLRVSKFFENGLDQDRWHRSLVEKMSLDLPGMRPPFFAERSMALDAIELLKFRHRIRNLYGEDLEPSRTMEMQCIAERFFGGFEGMHRAFKEKLLLIAEKLR
jgi:hypothetical protein